MLQSHGNYLLWLANHELAAGVRAKAGASDLVQQTFMRAQQGFDQFQGQSPEQLQGWLRKILLRNLANFHRDYLTAKKRQVTKEAPLGTGTKFEQQIVKTAADCKSPSSLVRHDEETNRLMAVIETLPDDYHQILKLRYWETMTFNEIGERMGRSAEAARKLWARAFHRLEKELGMIDDDGR